MKFLKIFFFVLLLTMPAGARAQESTPNEACFCYQNVAPLLREGAKNYDFYGDIQAKCVAINGNESQCSVGAQFTSRQARFDACEVVNTLVKCQEKLNTWEQEKARLVNEKKAGNLQASTTAILPDCALKDTLEPECRDISIFVLFLINVGRYLFSIVGALALAVFVYGGVMFIWSKGDAEKVKTAFGALKAGIVGLIIVFCAYVIVNFTAEALGVKTELRLPGAGSGQNR